MTILFWLSIFMLSLAALVKGAEWLLLSAERIGLALGLSTFFVGVTLVAIGTSLPDLVVSVVATLDGLDTFAAGNAIGSSIVNILLIIGMLTIIGYRLQVEKNLIDLDLPLLASAVGLFVLTAHDGRIVFWETALLLAAYVSYLLYTMRHRPDMMNVSEVAETLPDEAKPRHWYDFWRQRYVTLPQIKLKDIGLIVLGGLLLGFGAHYATESVVVLSSAFNVSAGLIALLIISVGTNLPELTVSLRAARAGQPEVAMGNVIGSNVLNVLVVVGLPGLFSTLVIDQATLAVGLPVMVIATILFVVSGISRRIYIWEGVMYLILYIFFVGTLVASV